MKYRGLLGISILVFTFILFGCSGDDESLKKRSITIAIEATGDIPVEFQKQIDRFNEQYEDVEASILTYAGAEAYETAIIGQIAGGNAPDIIWLDGGKKIQEFASSNVIIPLDDIMESEINSFEPSLMQAFKYNGKTYGVPKDYNTSVLFYQAPLFESAGLLVPTTVSEFVAAAELFTTDSIKGFGADPKLNYLYPFIATYGADFVQENGAIDVAKLSSEAHKEALSMIKYLYDNGYATSPYLSNAGWDGELVGKSSVAMLYGGSWITGVIEDPSKIHVAPLPIKKTAYSMLFTAGWAITQSSKYQEDAANLIRFISSDEELVHGNMVGLIGLPPKSSAMNQLIQKKDKDPFLPVYNEVVKSGVPFGMIDKKFVDSYNLALEDMLYNGQSVETTMKAIITFIQ